RRHGLGPPAQRLVIFNETHVRGVFVIDCDVFEDERGTFTPTWVEREFASRGLETRIAQCNSSVNRQRGTLRGMHYQAEPFGEVKIVRVCRGAIFDVAVDLRRDSPTFGRWEGVELDGRRPRMVYLPAGVAHGFQTLEDDTEVLYTVS